MKVVKIIIALALAVGLMTALFVSKAVADVIQSQDQTTTVNCSASGSYGQNTTCNTTTTQNQKQQVLGVITTDRKQIYHKPVATGLDTFSSAAAAGSLMLGSVATFIKIKSRA